MKRKKPENETVLDRPKPFRSTFGVTVTQNFHFVILGVGSVLCTSTQSLLPSPARWFQAPTERRVRHLRRFNKIRTYSVQLEYQTLHV